MPSKNTDSKTIDIGCVLIDKRRKILISPFRLTILENKYDILRVVIPFLRVAVPALRDQEEQDLKFYKPLTDISLSQQSHLAGEQVNLADPLPSSRSLQTILSYRSSVVDLVICVPDSQCSFFIY
jgi:hypothetical protein